MAEQNSTRDEVAAAPLLTPGRRIMPCTYLTPPSELNCAAERGCGAPSRRFSATFDLPLACAELSFTLRSSLGPAHHLRSWVAG